MKMNRKHRIPALFFMLVVLAAFAMPFAAMLSGCQSAGIVAPRNTNDDLAYSYAAVTSVRLTAANMIQAGTMTPETGMKVQAMSDQARALLDTARAAHAANNEAGAGAALAQVAAILTTLQGIVTPTQSVVLRPAAGGPK